MVLTKILKQEEYREKCEKVKKKNRGGNYI
jgi:hypothetical protein